MTATAEAYGFGARAPYATPRASEYDMKERVRLSGLFPRVRNEPMSKQLQVLLKEFEQNAALTGILERRRRLEERRQFELQGSEGLDAINRNLAPPFRAGLAGAATSAAVAMKLARSRVAARTEAAEAAARAARAVAAQAAPAAPGGVGVSSVGGSVGSGDPVVPVLSDEFTVSAADAKAKAKARSRSRATPSRSRPRSTTSIAASEGSGR